MDNWLTALLVFGAVALGMIGQGWASFLEHQRRSQILDLIKTMIHAGKEPPADLFNELRESERRKAPWSEVAVFGVLAFGFWFAFAYADIDRRPAFLVIAATMTLTSLGCLVLALARSRAGGGRPVDDDRR